MLTHFKMAKAIASVDSADSLCCKAPCFGSVGVVIDMLRWKNNEDACFPRIESSWVSGGGLSIYFNLCR